MKRLKNKLLAMETDTTTYKAMYEGSMTVIPPAAGMEPWVEYDSRYYAGEVGYLVEHTHKLAPDRPTVTVSIPVELFSPFATDAAVADFCLRAMIPYFDGLNEGLANRSRPDSENGKYILCHPGGEVLVRNSAYFAICPGRDYDYGTGNSVHLWAYDVPRTSQLCLCIKMQVQLPRRKLRRTVQMLCRDLPEAVERFIAEFDIVRCMQAHELAQRQADIRAYLAGSEYCAFIANGSILPRSKGTDLPMVGAVPFRSTAGDEIEVCGVRGMGIRRGVTVITGGGYSGKSTLLDAVSAGIYDHIMGDGRELCITDHSAMTVSAEDGRAVSAVNISPFIKWLPGGDTRNFSTDRASGSTSQAANIMEAVDSGAKLLLIDEDRSATNFMIRDRVMKTLIEREPITPFTDRVRELYRVCGVSTILVIGGSGEYLSVADRVYLMEDYLIHDVTARARALCPESAEGNDPPMPWYQWRTLYADGFTSYPDGSGSERMAVSDMGFILIGDEQIDVRGLHDIVSPRQLEALGFMLRYLEVHHTGRAVDLAAALDALYEQIEREGLDAVYSSFFTTAGRFLDLPRRCELIAVINRMRRIHFEGKLC